MNTDSILYSIKPAAHLRNNGVSVTPVSLPASGRFGFSYRSTPKTEQILAEYDSGGFILCSPRKLLDHYTKLLHEVRELRKAQEGK